MSPLQHLFKLINALMATNHDVMTRQVVATALGSVSRLRRFKEDGRLVRLEVVVSEEPLDVQLAVAAPIPGGDVRLILTTGGSFAGMKFYRMSPQVAASLIAELARAIADPSQ